MEAKDMPVPIKCWTCRNSPIKNYSDGYCEIAEKFVSPHDHCKKWEGRAKIERKQKNTN